MLIFCHPLVHLRQSLVTVWWDMTSDFWDLWADIYQGRLTTTSEYASTIYIRVSYWSLENWIGALKHVKIWLSQKDTCLSCQICYVCYILHVCQVCYWRYFQRYDIVNAHFLQPNTVKPIALRKKMLWMLSLLLCRHRRPLVGWPLGKTSKTS